MHAEIERRVRSAIIRFRLPWAAMVLSSLVFAALGLWVSDTGVVMETGVSPMSLPVIIVAAGSGALVFFLDRKLLAPRAIAARVPPNDIELALRHLLAGHLVLWSLAVVSPILGFAQLLLGGRPAAHLLLCGASVGILAYLMPTWSRIAARIEAILR